MELMTCRLVGLKRFSISIRSRPVAFVRTHQSWHRHNLFYHDFTLLSCGNIGHLSRTSFRYMIKNRSSDFSKNWNEKKKIKSKAKMYGFRYPRVKRSHWTFYTTWNLDHSDCMMWHVCACPLLTPDKNNQSVEQIHWSWLRKMREFRLNFSFKPTFVSFFIVVELAGCSYEFTELFAWMFAV